MVSHLRLRCHGRTAGKYNGTWRHRKVGLAPATDQASAERLICSGRSLKVSVGVDDVYCRCSFRQIFVGRSRIHGLETATVCYDDRSDDSDGASPITSARYYGIRQRALKVVVGMRCCETRRRSVWLR